MNLKVGNKSFFIESNHLIKEVTIIKIAENFCTVRFADSLGAIRVRMSKLYGTRDEAIEKLDSFKPNTKSEKPKSIRPPHPFW